MIVILLLILLFSVSIAPIFSAKKEVFFITATKVLMLILIAVAGAHLVFPSHAVSFSFNAVQFNNIHLVLAIQLDLLAKIMMIFILTISFFIYSYAENYLESDNTRMRFLSQFNLTILSVLLLVMSANLLTAFVAWQFIGISIYILLNHYHQYPAANRAAKKKFVINRIGDASFLLAIVLAYQTSAASNFLSIATSPHAELICGLIFISVMTKCAQFPFHIWLIDTMEAPTPVSALMHAGVINAGGILLARISYTLMQYPLLALLILVVGLISAALSIHWMNHQPDTKKKLAYSTMGQMGYMLTQCSLGAFPAAIFHLMSHGFYKASLFLNAGETLVTGSHFTKTQQFTRQAIIKSFLIGLVVFLIALWTVHQKAEQLPLLIYGFMLATIVSLVLKIEATASLSNREKITYYAIVEIMLLVYLYCMHGFARIFYSISYSSILSSRFQFLVVIILLGLQAYVWLNGKKIDSPKLKDTAENIFRRGLLNPIRLLGDRLNFERAQNSLSFGLLYIAGILLLATTFHHLFIHHQNIHSTAHHNPQFFVFIYLLLSIMLLIAANRCESVKMLIIYLTLFELAFVNIAFFAGVSRIGIFHLFNMSSALIMLVLLAKKNRGKKIIVERTNHLPTRAFYLVLSLLLLIGIPGTASFISEFYLLGAIIHSNMVLVMLYIIIIVLIAIVVMHSLQLYVFNEEYSILLRREVSKKNYLIFSMIISINIIFGLFPNILLRHF